MSETPRNPFPTVDAVVIRYVGETATPEILLVKRKRAPMGWALPGGFVDYGESTETAVIRELFEETGLTVDGNPSLLCVMSEPDRDPRQHNISIVYLIEDYDGELEISDVEEVEMVKFFPLADLPELVFDHKEIIDLHLNWIAR